LRAVAKVLGISVLRTRGANFFTHPVCCLFTGQILYLPYLHRFLSVAFLHRCACLYKCVCARAHPSLPFNRNTEGGRDRKAGPITIFLKGNPRQSEQRGCTGVSREVSELADAAITIPMAPGFVQSFNVSVAAALVMYEARASRQRLVGRHPDVDAHQQQVLEAIMMLRHKVSLFWLAVTFQ
jgi:hypothetical protein